MRFTRSVDADRLREFLETARSSPLSYPEVGASLGSRPDGYHHDSYDVALGTGDAVYRRAIRGLEEWQTHRAAGVIVYPPDAPIENGTTVALALPAPGLHVLAACRIVAVVREADRFGFAYGTLAGHPEQGEEAFLIERDGDTVRFTITAFSRPHALLARIGFPLARVIQRRVTRAYLTGLQAFVTPVT
jgi:uncharacterized protein (UPF0548 family)